jgi:gluconate 2-dehydrogenase gamma chain
MSRRVWLGAVWPQVPAAQNGNAPFQAFDPAAAREIEAICERILPADETPGARAAGVIYFIDRALATFDRDKRAAYRQGLRQVQAQRKKLFPASASIAGLTAEQQDQLLHAMENTDFFRLVRTHTIMGFFGHPSYGGNRGQAGWKLIGFEDQHHFEPPFGFYDR